MKVIGLDKVQGCQDWGSQQWSAQVRPTGISQVAAQLKSNFAEDETL